MSFRIIRSSFNKQAIKRRKVLVLVSLTKIRKRPLIYF